MTTLQISMTEEKYQRVKTLLVKAKGSFMLTGEKYNFGDTIIRVLEEWSRDKGFLKETNQERKGSLAISLIKDDPEEYALVLGLIKSCEKGVGPGPARDLTNIINRIDRYWRVSVGKDALNSNKQIAQKARELFLGEGENGPR